ncbi:NADH-quinone oxidoreductase subunit N [Candidatus Poriferisodalis sp.]|uniref:NADH-quinone oxidoreductase subunit N n=1 Tax=Candidatus Poriferisodalis sp. TaxID=3101277 RepID=UPI003B02A6FE
MGRFSEAFVGPAVDWWVLVPQIVLVGAALGLLLVASLAPRELPGWVPTVVSVAAGAGAAVVAAVQWGMWGSAPRSTLADAFVSDGFGLLLTVLVGAGVVMTALVAHPTLERYGMAPPEFAALVLTSAAGAVVMAGANDLIVLFLGLESLSIATYVMIALAGRRATAREAAVKYFVLGAFSSAFFLYGIALVYGSTGSTKLTVIRSFLSGSARLDSIAGSDYLLLAGIALLLVGLGFKIAAVPFHFWSPDVYEGAPSPVTGYLASIAKAAAFAALVRVLYVAVVQHSAAWAPILVGLAFATLAVGAVMAICQSDVKRMLAYSSISHAGFVLVGLSALAGTDGASRWIVNVGDEATAVVSVGAADPAAAASSVVASGAAPLGTVASEAVSSVLVYLVVYAFLALGSFAVLSAVGSQRPDAASSGPANTGTANSGAASPHALSRYGGLARRHPVLALAFTLLLLAQAGVPLTGGFLAKFLVITAALEGKVYVLAVVAMVTAVVGAYAYLRVVLAMFAPGAAADEGAEPSADADAGAGEHAPVSRAGRARWGGLPLATVVAIAVAVAITLLVGVAPQPLIEWAIDAASAVIP